jgi:hypothetical protein
MVDTHLSNNPNFYRKSLAPMYYSLRPYMIISRKLCFPHKHASQTTII